MLHAACALHATCLLAPQSLAITPVVPCLLPAATACSSTCLAHLCLFRQLQQQQQRSSSSGGLHAGSVVHRQLAKQSRYGFICVRFLLANTAQRSSASGPCAYWVINMSGTEISACIAHICDACSRAVGLNPSQGICIMHTWVSCAWLCMKYPARETMLRPWLTSCLAASAAQLQPAARGGL